MARPTQFHISHTALLHNVGQLRKQAPKARLVAVVKSNAYGCGIEQCIPQLEGHVDKFAVTSLDEALAIRRIGAVTPCVILHGVFGPQEWQLHQALRLEYVIHHEQQLNWLLNLSLAHPVKVWLKVNTGMNRLGFKAEEIPAILTQLRACSWVDPNIILMTHFANADVPTHPLNAKQIEVFSRLSQETALQLSLNNSAAIFSFPHTQADYVRPGLSLYGVSPFPNRSGRELGLLPVIQFSSAITHVFSVQPHEQIGYGSSWQAARPSRIAVVAAGYGDGYPRHILPNTYVLVQKKLYVPIVGKISMSYLTLDVTDFPEITAHSPVELWGPNLPLEYVAQQAGTIPYELMVQMNPQ